MRNKALVREGIPTLVVLTIITIILFIIYPWLILFGIGLILFVIYFFRDPIRKAPMDEDNIIVSPADGIITSIKEVEENKFIKQRAICISIFMSPMDVHINRSPINGYVDYIEYKKGKFMFASNPESHNVNEKNYIGIKNDKINVLVVQIAGIMARRIVNWTILNQKKQIGDKIGMIKFSSGTQIFLPKDTEILVRTGDRVVSGETLIGRYSND